jgi:xanthine/CO dehydrogenase XdhC/CoxF family maturation factor
MPSGALSISPNSPSLDQQAGFPLLNRCLRDEADETAGKAVQCRSGKAKISLEAIRCRQRSTLGQGHAHEERQNRGFSGSTELAIVVSRRSRREISLCKAGDRHKYVGSENSDPHEKLTKFRDHLP